MKYLGGKSRVAAELAACISALSTNHELFVEPFMGGGNMTEHLSGWFDRGLAYDVVPDLAILYSSLQAGWQPPETCSEADHARLRGGPPSALRALVGFGCSFGGDFFKGFAKARGDDYYGAAKRSVLRMAGRCQNVKFSCADYRVLRPPKGSVIYCDPPYAGTSGYSSGAFCSKTFWATAEQWAGAGCQVFVSEYLTPTHWTTVWEKPRLQGLRSRDKGQIPVLEKLVTLI